jgi:hypothetical protein
MSPLERLRHHVTGAIERGEAEPIVEVRTCQEDGCDRRSVMPSPYPAECHRHYIASIERAQRVAAARFQDHIKQLTERPNVGAEGTAS